MKISHVYFQKVRRAWECLTMVGTAAAGLRSHTCKGHDSSADPPDICGANAYKADPMTNYKLDEYSGNKAFAVVADSCQDNNYW
jgi:hypothetical protein